MQRDFLHLLNSSNMENGNQRGQDGVMEEMSMQIAQLRALTVDLKAGLVGTIHDLSTQKQSSCILEERMRKYQNDTEEKILGITNSLNTFEEDLGTAQFQIKELNCRHVEMQRGVELFHAEVGRHLLTCQQRKNSQDVSPDSLRHFFNDAEEHAMQHHHASRPNGSPRQTASPEQDIGCLPQGWTRRQAWAAPKDPTEGAEGGRKRYAAALELLESERLYVSHLSLLLKANITFNGTEAIHPKGKRPFPSSLRFLIQQHLDLLHTLQARVLRFQWQGIMGDVFLRLFSKESEFLDFYVAYLKELPDCLAVVGMYAPSFAEAAGLFESDVTGKENRLPLHTLLLQPVQRIPEYLTLLQSLLKLTEAEHPDYFLLLVCIQQLRAFTDQQSHLLQQSQELLLHGCREVKRQHQSQVKRRVVEQRQGKEPQDWESGVTSLSHSPFCGDDANPWLRSVQEAGRESGSRPPATSPSASPAFLPPPPPETLGLEVLYEDGDSLGNISLSLFDSGSTASSASSLDLSFVRSPESCGGAEAYAAGVARSCFPGRGSESPQEAYLMPHRPLQAVQRKSKSLNGLQLDSAICGDTKPPEFSGTPNSRSPHGGRHAWLERQPSRGSVGGKTQRSVSPLQKLEPLDLQRGLHKVAPLPNTPQTTIAKLQLASSSDCGPPAWVEDSRRTRGSEENMRSFSGRSRKEDQKGGIRSSFRKLFKKK